MSTEAAPAPCGAVQAALYNAEIDHGTNRNMVRFKPQRNNFSLASVDIKIVL